MSNAAIIVRIHHTSQQRSIKVSNRRMSEVSLPILFGIVPFNPGL